MEENGLQKIEKQEEDGLQQLEQQDVNDSMNLKRFESTAANWNIGFGIFWIVVGVLTLIFIVGVFLIIFGWKTVYWNKEYKKEQNDLNTWKAGIYGTFWGPGVTGTMIFRGSNKIEFNEMNSLMTFSWASFWVSIVSIFIWFLGIVSIIMLIMLLLKTYVYKVDFVYPQMSGDDNQTTSTSNDIQKGE